MATVSDKPDAKKVGDESSKKPSKLFTHPLQPYDEGHPEAVSGTVVHTQPVHDYPLFSAPAPREHPAPHRGYTIASLVLTCATGALSIGSIAIAAVTLHRTSTFQSKEEGDSLGAAITALFYCLVMVESCLCFIAALTCFVLLLCVPHRVLIRNPSNGSFICLCVSVFLLFLFSIYSIVIQALFSGDNSGGYAPPVGVVAVHCARAVGLVSFFAVLVANSKVLPHDPCM